MLSMFVLWVIGGLSDEIVPVLFLVAAVLLRRSSSGFWSFLIVIASLVAAYEVAIDWNAHPKLHSRFGMFLLSCGVLGVALSSVHAAPHRDFSQESESGSRLDDSSEPAANSTILPNAGYALGIVSMISFGLVWLLDSYGESIGSLGSFRWTVQSYSTVITPFLFLTAALFLLRSLPGVVSSCVLVGSVLAAAGIVAEPILRKLFNQTHPWFYYLPIRTYYQLGYLIVSGAFVGFAFSARRKSALAERESEVR